MAEKVVVRILLYSGEEDRVERTLDYSDVQPGKPFHEGGLQVEEIFRGRVAESVLAEVIGMLARGKVEKPSYGASSDNEEG